jgi:triphosphoribosyl-dephospho-CoA synthetase
MLTKTDLQQFDTLITKRIHSETRKIVQEETRKIVQEETRKIVQEETRKIVQEETRKIVQEEVQTLKEDVSHIRKDMKTIVSFFDREYLELRKRVERIELHLSLPHLS